MLDVVFAVFLALHGLVHLWYVVLSQGWVQVEEQMGWNGHSWLLSSVLSTETLLPIASVLYGIVALGFVVGAAGVVWEQDWHTTVLVGAAVLSTLVLVALWDGEPTLLVEKGLVGVVINLGIVAYLLYW